MKPAVLLILAFSIISLLIETTNAQVIPIDSVRKQDANGVPLLLNQIVTVRGVITTSGELGNVLVYFQDPTGGLVGYDAAFNSGTQNNDSVQVTGKVVQFNGLTELQPVNSFSVLGAGTTPVPVTITPGMFRVNGENYEGRLSKIDSITAVKNLSGVPVTQWIVTGSGTNYRIFKGNDSCEVRIYATTNIANSQIPPFPFSIIGLGGQYDSQPPYNTGYELIPRSLSDLITIGGGPLLSQISYSNIQQTSVTINWTTSTPADSKVRWMLSDSNYQNIVYRDSIFDSAPVTSHSIILNNLRSGRIYVFNVTSSNAGGSTTSPVQYFATQSTSTGTINVYFNRSVDTSINTGEPAQGNVNFQTKLLQRINSAQHSIDMALYSFNELTQIRDALINAKIRGVRIRFVYDSRTNQALVNDLIAAGIPIMKRNYQTSDIMHNKFFVFDNRDTTSGNDDWVWTGSANVTFNQFFSDANNVIEIQDRTLASIFTREFEEMWGSAADLPDPAKAKFGPAKADNVPHIVNVNGTRVELYFSPSDLPSTKIEDMISVYTDFNIYFCAYAFTRYNISNRMYSKWQQGKDVKGVFDSSSIADLNSVYHEMLGQGPYGWNPPADVWADVAENIILHHKYMLIDAPYPNSNPVTETGSYNYSNSATFNNDENLLILYSQRVSNLYLQEFYKRYRASGGQGIVVIGVKQISNVTPGQFLLYQNYPNPFNPISIIKYQISKAGITKLKIYDILGRETAVLVDEVQQTGTYEVKLDASGLSSGIYFYTLLADGVLIDSKKMVLLK